MACCGKPALAAYITGEQQERLRSVLSKQLKAKMP